MSSVQFSHSVVSDSVTPWTAARQASLSITNFHSLPKLMSIESVMPSSYLILCCPLLLLLLLLCCISRLRLCATPKMADHQAPPSLGFSRQEHWNRLPFPSPMHESEKWKWSCSVVSHSLRLHGLQPTMQEYWSGLPLPSLPFLLPPSILPSIRVFSNELVLCISGQSIRVSASASVLPMNIPHH